MYNLDQLLRDTGTVQLLRRQIDGQASATLLRSLKVKIISNCNLRCQMCRYWQIPKDRLPDEVVKHLLDDAASLGCEKVHFSGGEVTLHPGLHDFIAHAAGLGIRVNLTSNGMLMDKDRARAWIDAGLRSASFSLDGTNARTHDAIRGVEGAFRRTCRSIRCLRREIDRRNARLRIRVNMVISQLNMRQLPGLIELAGRLGAVDAIPMPIDGKRAPRPTAAEIERFNRDIVPQVAELRKQFGMPIDAGRLYPFGRSESEIAAASRGEYGFGYYHSHPCYAPWLHAFISHDGDVYACCMTRERMPSLGNVRQQRLLDIFQGSAYEQFRQQMLQQRLKVCANCDQYLSENRLVHNRLERASVLTGQPALLPQLDAFAWQPVPVSPTEGTRS
ncbi:MAG: radical SAM protein [Pirellulales bacterium]